MPYTVRKNKLRRLKRKFRRKRARKAVDRRQNRNIAKLYKMVRYGDERKWIDQSNTISLSTTWTQMLTRDLTYIAAGDTSNTRNGNKIKIHSHHLKVVVTGGDVTNLYRFCVIRFSAVAASQVQIEDALQSPVISSPFNLMTFKKRDTDSKYQILYDTGIQRTAGDGTAGAPKQSTSQRVWNINLKPYKGYFTGYNGSGANACVQGFTYLIGVSDSALVPHVQFQISARTIFTG